MEKLTLKEFNDRWTYEADRIDGWSLTSRGDCDDYALSVAWIMAEHSWVRFWTNVWTFKTTFHRVRTDSGDAHIVLKHKGLFIDNIKREWREEHNYKPIFPWVWLPPFVAVKMIVGFTD